MTTGHQYINPLHANQKNQINQWFRQTPTGKCNHTGKVNSVDNQWVTPKIPKITGNKPAKQESPLHPHTTPNTQPTTPENHPQATTAVFANNTPLPENETPLIINHLHPKTHETTGNKPAISPFTNTIHYPFFTLS